METFDLRSVLAAYGIDPEAHTVAPIGAGLIHATYVILDHKGQPLHILQRVNHHVFKRPDDIAWNLDQLKGHLERIGSEYFIPFPIPNSKGDAYVKSEGAYFRLSAYVADSRAISVCTAPEQAYEAAMQFGRFTAAFRSFDAPSLQYTIPRFHDLFYRWEQFGEALHRGNPQRIRETDREIKLLTSRSDIVRTYESMTKDSECRLRVTHHDTKISNVLFDQRDKGICVIDLDTVMPGYHVSDLGDMFRTYLSPASEEEADLHEVFVRPDYLEAIRSGYLEQLGGLLTPTEQGLVDYAGEFMIYMQALRFLTDYLNDDSYYGARYEGHNLVRARNQIHLLEAYCRA